MLPEISVGPGIATPHELLTPSNHSYAKRGHGPYLWAVPATRPAVLLQNPFKCLSALGAEQTVAEDTAATFPVHTDHQQ